MDSAPPRRRRARPVPEAPIEALVARAEVLAKGWLLAIVEQEPLSRAGEIAAGEWASEGPRACAAILRALGSDEELERIPAGVGRLAGSRGLDPLRAVIWSALRSAWPDAQPDQVWDLGERLAAVVEALRGSAADEAVAARWPDALSEAIAAARDDRKPLALLLVELSDADRLIAVETAEEARDVLSRFRAAVRGSLGPRQLALDDGEARVWVLAPGAARGDALARAATVAAGVRAATPWRGAPLIASLGVAMLGADGQDAGSLIAAAEEAMLSAAAGGIEVARLGGEDESG
jgi:GGDEF domain-containing protein